MDKKLIFDAKILSITIKRLAQQLIENHGGFEDTLMIGLQPRGVYLAQRLQNTLRETFDKKIELGILDITFHRDDFRRRATPLKANNTDIPFLIEGKKVLLVDDVLFTGRSVRAALDAMNTFGRPEKVELLVLINRKYGRDLPIEPFYVGRTVNTLESQRIRVELKEQGADNDYIWLINQ